MSNSIKLLKKQKNPARFLLGYFLWKSGICSIVTYTVDGVKFNFYKSGLSMNLFIDRAYVKDDLNTVTKYLSRDKTFIDIGANIGTWSLFAAKTVGTGGKILSFEPHPLTFRYLKGNIELNKYNNIEAFNVGCSDEAGELFFSSNFDTMNHITFEKANSIVIPVKPLDAYTEPLEVIDLMKIDVEGFELNVLKGATKTLQKTKVIIFESNGAFQKKYQYKTSDITALLNNAGFRVYKEMENGGRQEIDLNYMSDAGEDLVAFKTEES